jgi:hypothetical protein
MYRLSRESKFPTFDEIETSFLSRKEIKKKRAIEKLPLLVILR